MKLEKKGGYGKLIQKLKKAPQRLGDLGEGFVAESVADMEATYISRLEAQGRPGGEPPPLSAMTHHLYEELGGPDGSGIRNHIRSGVERIGFNSEGFVGILEGKPTMIAKVQDEGCVIPVTDKMRGFLAAHGVYLKATTVVIEIPARHSWSKAVEEATARSRDRLKVLMNELWKD